MMSSKSFAVAGSLAIVLAACSAPTVAPPPGYLLPSATSVANPGLEIQVHLAGYLVQGGIVLQLSNSEIHSARLHRWAEPLAQQLQRSLHAGLGAGGWDDGAQLVVRVSQFHGVRTPTGDRAVLHGSWHYSSRHGQPRQGNFEWQGTIPGDGYGALVETLDRGWQHVVNRMAADLRTDRT